MSNFGEAWRIDGVTAAYVTPGPANGQYQVLFERSNAELLAIEAINWSAPTVELLRTDCPDMQGLPEGYGFTVADITYDHNAKSYTVTLQVAKQYLGDVSGYEAQVTELQEQVSSLTGQVEQAQAQVEAAQVQLVEAQTQTEQAQTQAAEAQAASIQKDETIAAQAQEIEALRADSGAAVVASLENAYQEGVESNG